MNLGRPTIREDPKNPKRIWEDPNTQKDDDRVINERSDTMPLPVKVLDRYSGCPPDESHFVPIHTKAKVRETVFASPEATLLVLKLCGTKGRDKMISETAFALLAMVIAELRTPTAVTLPLSEN